MRLKKRWDFSLRSMNYTYYRRYRPQTKKRPTSFKSFFWLVLILVVLALLLQACVSLVGSFMAEKKDEATLTVNEGSAEVMEWGQTEAAQASDAQLLLVGDTVQSEADSLVTLRFAGDMEIHLDQSTKLLFQDAEVGEDVTTITVELLSGRVWVSQVSEEQNVDLIFKTKTANMETTQGRFLIANQDTKQYAYSFDGTLKVDYVDRSQKDSIIETVRVDKGKKTILTQEAEVALLARESLTLLGEAGDDFVGDRFVMWNLGTVDTISEGTGTDEEPALGEPPIVDESAETETAETLAEEPVVEVSTDPVVSETPQPTLCVQVTSPGLSVSIDKSAIAIEGSITCGTASTVTVTWAGNGAPYVLGGFAPGDSSFRYVADASYGNLKAGSNTYTIVATAADGTVSQTVTVTIEANF